MSIRHLDKFFSAKSVVLVGASDRAGSVGKTVAENLLRGGFKGPVWFVNPKHKKILDRPCYADIQSLPEAPDLAVIATPPLSLRRASGSKICNRACWMRQILRDNMAMLNTCRDLGIQVAADHADPVYLIATLPLRTGTNSKLNK